MMPPTNFHLLRFIICDSDGGTALDRFRAAAFGTLMVPFRFHRMRASQDFSMLYVSVEAARAMLTVDAMR